MSDSPTGATPGTTANGSRVFGIRVKLFLAFFALAGLTVIACAVAWYAFVTIDRSVTRVTDDSVPGMVAALALAKSASEIAAAAPSILAAEDHDELAAQETAVEQNIDRFVHQSTMLDEHIADAEQRLRFDNLTADLVVALATLRQAVDQRLDLEQRLETSTAAMLATHDDFLQTLEPLVDDAVYALVVSGEAVMAENSSAITGLVDDGVSRIDRLLTINATANLAAGLMAEAINVDDPVLLQPLEERFVSAALTIERNLDALRDDASTRQLRLAVSAMLEPGLGDDTIFMAANTYSLSSAGLQRSHDELLLILTPMIDDAAFDLVLSAEAVTAGSQRSITGLIEGGVNTLTVLLTLRAEGNLAASLLSEAAAAPSASLLRPLNERFTAAQASVTDLVEAVPDGIAVDGLSDVSQQLLSFGTGQGSIFALRRDELARIDAGFEALDTSRSLSLALGDQIAGLVAAAQAESDDAAFSSGQAIDRSQLAMLVIIIVSVAGAALVMYRYVNPRVIRPVEDITSAMTDLAGGDTSVDIPGRDRDDELGRMAQALGVFRDTAIAVQKANLREIETARRRLADAIESISEGFTLYDDEDCLVVSNQQYQQLLYPGMTERFEPGMSFEAILRRAISQGFVRDAEGREEAWIAERLARHRNPGPPHVQQRRDGRYIMVSERRTEEGGTVAVYSDITELKERETQLAQKSSELEQLAGQLAKYLSPQVYESIFSGRQEVKVASQRKKLTVFFSDIADFTETTEKLESEDLTVLLNEYLTEMSRIALNHGATIDKYVGDAIVIFFGDPETRGVREDALACVEMAIEMRQRMTELQAHWRSSGVEKPLTCRIGINTGYCTVGNFGSEARMDYTIIGAGVNLASRLESAAAPGEIVVSYETHAWIKDRIHCEARDPIRVKGVSGPVATYRVVDMIDRLEEVGGVVREEQPNLRLDMNVTAMSEAERTAAEDALRQALAHLDGGDDGKPDDS